MKRLKLNGRKVICCEGDFKTMPEKESKQLALGGKTRDTVREFSQHFGKLSLQRAIELLENDLIHPSFISIDWEAAKSISPPLARKLLQAYLDSLMRHLMRKPEKPEHHSLTESLDAILETTRKKAKDEKLPEVEREAEILQRIINFFQAWVRDGGKIQKYHLERILQRTTKILTEADLADSLTILNILLAAVRAQHKHLIHPADIKDKILPHLEILLSSAIPAFRYYVSHYATLVLHELLKVYDTQQPHPEQAATTPNEKKIQLQKTNQETLLRKWRTIVSTLKKAAEGRESTRGIVTAVEEFAKTEELRTTPQEAMEILSAAIATWRAQATLGKGKRGYMPPAFFLVGPRGVGKTSIAEMAATQAGLPIVSLTATAATRYDVQIPVSSRSSLSELRTKARMAAANLVSALEELKTALESAGKHALARTTESTIKDLEAIREKLEDSRLADLLVMEEIGKKQSNLENLHRYITNVLLSALETGIQDPQQRQKKMDDITELYTDILSFAVGNITEVNFVLSGKLGRMAKAQTPFVLFIDEVGYNTDFVTAFLSALTHGTFSDTKLPPFFTILASNTSAEGAHPPIPPLVARCVVLYVSSKTESMVEFIDERLAENLLSGIQDAAQYLKQVLEAPEAELTEHLQRDEKLQRLRGKGEQKIKEVISILDDIIRAASERRYVDCLDGVRNLLLSLTEEKADGEQEVLLPRFAQTIEVNAKHLRIRLEQGLKTKKPYATFIKHLIARIEGEKEKAGLPFSASNFWGQLLSTLDSLLRKFLHEELEVKSHLDNYIQAGQPVPLGSLAVAPAPRATTDYTGFMILTFLVSSMVNCIIEKVTEAERKGEELTEKEVKQSILQAIRETFSRRGTKSLLPKALAGTLGRQVSDKFLQGLEEEIKKIVERKEKEKKEEEETSLVATHLFTAIDSLIQIYSEVTQKKIAGEEELSWEDILLKSTEADRIKREIKSFSEDTEKIQQFLLQFFSNAEATQQYINMLIELNKETVAITRKMSTPDDAQKLLRLWKTTLDNGNYFGVLSVALAISTTLSKKPEGKHIAETIREYYAPQMHKAMARMLDSVTSSIVQNPQDERNHTLAFAFTNFLTMVASLPTTLAATEVVIPTLKPTLNAWLSFCYNLGIATSLSPQQTFQPEVDALQVSAAKQSLESKKAEEEKLDDIYAESIAKVYLRGLNAIQNTPLAQEVIPILETQAAIQEILPRIKELLTTNLTAIRENPYLAIIIKTLYISEKNQWTIENQIIESPEQIRLPATAANAFAQSLGKLLPYQLSSSELHDICRALMVAAYPSLGARYWVAFALLLGKMLVPIAANPTENEEEMKRAMMTYLQSLESHWQKTIRSESYYKERMAGISVELLESVETSLMEMLGFPNHIAKQHSPYATVLYVASKAADEAGTNVKDAYDAIAQAWGVDKSYWDLVDEVFGSEAMAKRWIGTFDGVVKTDAGLQSEVDRLVASVRGVVERKVKEQEVAEIPPASPTPEPPTITPVEEEEIKREERVEMMKAWLREYLAKRFNSS